MNSLFSTSTLASRGELAPELIPLLWSLGNAAAQPSNTRRPALCKSDAAGQGRVRVTSYLNKVRDANARRTTAKIHEKCEKNARSFNPKPAATVGSYAASPSSPDGAFNPELAATVIDAVAAGSGLNDPGSAGLTEVGFGNKTGDSFVLSREFWFDASRNWILR
jgi:hypothetical protein